MGPRRGNFGISLGLLWGDFGESLGSLWEHWGTTVGSRGYHFGLTLVAFFLEKHHLGGKFVKNGKLA